jgi:hypothetical protein
VYRPGDLVLPGRHALEQACQNDECESCVRTLAAASVALPTGVVLGKCNFTPAVHEELQLRLLITLSHTPFIRPLLFRFLSEQCVPLLLESSLVAARPLCSRRSSLQKGWSPACVSLPAPQAPILRTEYLRSAWQAYDDNAVRFSLDEHMLLLREAPPAAGGSNGSSGGWCRPLESLPQIPSTDAVR